MTCDAAAFIVAFDYSKDERQLTYVRREREKMWRKCRQIYPNNIWEESADKDRARRMKDRGYFTDLYHCNEPNWTRWQALEDDVVMCMFAAGTER